MNKNLKELAKKLDVDNRVAVRSIVDEYGLEWTFVRELICAVKAGNKYIDFNEVIWEKDIDKLVKNLRDWGATEITVSSTYSGLVETIAKFEEYGCKLAGLTKVYTGRLDWEKQMQGIEEKEMVPAFRIKIK